MGSILKPTPQGREATGDHSEKRTKSGLIVVDIVG